MGDPVDAEAALVKHPRPLHWGARVLNADMRRPRADRGENHRAGRNIRHVGRRACISSRIKERHLDHDEALAVCERIQISASKSGSAPIARTVAQGCAQGDILDQKSSRYLLAELGTEVVG